MKTSQRRPAQAGAGVSTRAAASSTGAHPRTPDHTLPVLFSLPVHEKLELPPRAELLPKIENGELDHLDVKIKAYGPGRNRNPYRFADADLPAFAQSFEGQPFLRNHDTWDIDARDGTIVDSQLEAGFFVQTVRLTTRRGMTDFVEGKIDRFSIGWFYDDVMCSICNSSWFGDCVHWPGRTYKTAAGDKMCELIFVNPRGKETSAVNTPAVEGTGVLARLSEYKLEVTGGPATADTHARRASAPPSRKGEHMKKPNANAAGADTVELEEQLDAETQAALSLQGANDAIADLQATAQQASALHVEQCRTLLDSSMAASKLPPASQAAVRKPFDKLLAAGKPFLASELQEAISDKREELAAITAPGLIAGPGRSVSGIFNGEDMLQAAVDDLLEAPRDNAAVNLKVPRLTGIREAYLLATGDRDFVGGYFEEFSLVTANFPKIVKNALNKRLVQAWKNYGKTGYTWWEKITTIEHFELLDQVDWLVVGTIGSLPSVSEQGEYTELAIGDNGETSDWTKYGGYVPITLEAMLRDNVRALKLIPNEIALGALRNISEQIAAIFTQASGAGPTLSDTGALFNATAVTTAGGHANLLTTALGTTYTAWDAVAAAMFDQPMLVKNATGYYGVGKKQAVEPTICLVPRALKSQAEALFIPRWASNVEAIASAGGPSYGGVVTPITVPEWTDATDWAAVVDPSIVPGIMLGEIFGVVPQMFVAGSEIDPAMFANDESRIKVRQFLTIGIANWRALHKSNVA